MIIHNLCFLNVSFSVNRFELLKAERRSSAKVTDFFGSERKMIPLATKSKAIVKQKNENSSEDQLPAHEIDQKPKEAIG